MHCTYELQHDKVINKIRLFYEQYYYAVLCLILKSINQFGTNMITRAKCTTSFTDSVYPTNTYSVYPTNTYSVYPTNMYSVY